MNRSQTFVAVLDMDYTAASFDAVTWMVRAMYERDRNKCQRMHIVIVPNSKTGLARDWGKHDAAATQWRFWHIVMAAVPLTGSDTTVTLAPSRTWASRLLQDPYFHDVLWYQDGKAHFMGPLIDAARLGLEIPKLCATDAARRYVNSWFGKNDQKPVVTITTRGQSTDPDRNSNAAAHGEMREWLRGKGYEVVHMIDSQVSLSREPDGCFAECDVDLRLALYERAQMNIIGNNGPQELLKFGHAPYLIFLGDLSQGWREHFKRYFHMEVGEQLPWTRANDQKLIYSPDSFENLRKEFESWEVASSSVKARRGVVS